MTTRADFCNGIKDDSKPIVESTIENTIRTITGKTVVGLNEHSASVVVLFQHIGIQLLESNTIVKLCRLCHININTLDFYVVLLTMSKTGIKLTRDRYLVLVVGAKSGIDNSVVIVDDPASCRRFNIILFTV